MNLEQYIEKFYPEMDPQQKELVANIVDGYLDQYWKISTYDFVNEQKSVDDEIITIEDIYEALGLTFTNFGLNVEHPAWWVRKGTKEAELANLFNKLTSNCCNSQKPIGELVDDCE